MNFSRLDELKDLRSSRCRRSSSGERTTRPSPKRGPAQWSFNSRTSPGFHSIANAKLFFYEEHPEEVARLIDRFLGAAAR